jgi:hypothetical protein
MTELEFWRHLADLRGELVGALMSRNHAKASVLIDEINRHLDTQEDNTPYAIREKVRKDNLLDILSAIEDAVGDLKDQLNL